METQCIVTIAWNAVGQFLRASYPFTCKKGNPYSIRMKTDQ